jgi:hypothetical protein
MCGCLSSGFFVTVLESYFLLVDELPMFVSTDNISVSKSASTGAIAAWNTNIVSFDCPYLRSSVGSPFVFSDKIQVSSVSW